MGNPTGMIPAPATLITRTRTRNCKCKWRHASSLHHWAWSLSEQKIPFWPWEGIFQWRDIPKATEEAALHMNALLSRLAQQSLSHMTSLNPGSSTQSYQAHNPAGFPVLPEKDECFHQGKSESQVKVLVPLGGQETLLDWGPHRTGLMTPCSKWHESVSQICRDSLQQLLSVFGLGLILDQTREIGAGWPLFPELRSSHDIRDIQKRYNKGHCRLQMLPLSTSKMPYTARSSKNHKILLWCTLKPFCCQEKTHISMTWLGSFDCYYPLNIWHIWDKSSLFLVFHDAAGSWHEHRTRSSLLFSLSSHKTHFGVMF